jgi:hypothetical protein
MATTYVGWRKHTCEKLRTQSAHLHTPLSPIWINGQSWATSWTNLVSPQLTSNALRVGWAAALLEGRQRRVPLCASGKSNNLIVA